MTHHGGARSGDFADDHYVDPARARPAGVTSLLATHRVQDAFGLANFRFDKASNRVLPISKNGASPAVNEQAAREEVGRRPIYWLCVRARSIYEGAADDMLHSSDEYLKKFLASAE